MQASSEGYHAIHSVADGAKTKAIGTKIGVARVARGSLLRPCEQNPSSYTCHGFRSCHRLTLEVGELKLELEIRISIPPSLLLAPDDADRKSAGTRHQFAPQ